MPESRPSRRRTIPGPRGPIAVEQRGEGPPLLLLAGLGAGKRIWGELTSLLARQFTVLAPDNRGVGGSREGEPFTIEGAAEDAAQVIGGCGFPHAAVLGVSLGGVLACRLAGVHPGMTTRLAAVSCPARNTPFNRRLCRFFELILSRMSRDEAAECLMTFAFGAAFADRFPAFVDQAAALWTPAPDDLPGITAQIAALRTNWDLRPLLRGIACPTLVVAGEVDPVVPLAASRELAEAIPGARLRVVPGAAHSVLAEGGPQLLREVSDFLAAEGP